MVPLRHARSPLERISPRRRLIARPNGIGYIAETLGSGPKAMSRAATFFIGLPRPEAATGNAGLACRK
jgi:hypothetical protein